MTEFSLRSRSRGSEPRSLCAPVDDPGRALSMGTFAAHDACKRRTVGLFGYGAFGRLIAQHLAQAFDIKIFDVQAEPGRSWELGTFATLEEAASCDIVIIATPVSEISRLAKAIAPLLKPGSLVLDVGSVKVVPARVLEENLPEYVDIVCTHPLFGPQSARDGLSGLKVVLCPIRGRRLRQVRRFLKGLSLQVIVATPEQHDEEAAMVQGLTHLIAKVLVCMEPLPSNMTTRSFDLLMQAVEMVRHDSPSVFLAIERDNPYAKEVRERFFRLATEVNQTLTQHD